MVPSLSNCKCSQPSCHMNHLNDSSQSESHTPEFATRARQAMITSFTWARTATAVTTGLLSVNIIILIQCQASTWFNCAVSNSNGSHLHCNCQKHTANTTNNDSTKSSISMFPQSRIKPFTSSLPNQILHIIQTRCRTCPSVSKFQFKCPHMLLYQIPRNVLCANISWVIRTRHFSLRNCLRCIRLSQP